MRNPAPNCLHQAVNFMIGEGWNCEGPDVSLSGEVAMTADERPTTDRGVRMRFISEEISEGVSERLFELDVNGETVPGALWVPTDATGPRPLVLMGHGGTQHKKVDTLLARARRYVRHLGYAVAAIDAPGHGDRITAEEQAERSAAIQRRIAERRP